MTQNRDYRDNGTRLVNNVGKKKRYGFVGSAINSDEFEVVSVGAGMTAGVVSNSLTITTGTTASSETIIRSKEVWGVPSLMEFQLALSQRIANQEFRVEYVSVDKDTLQPDGRDLMGWMFDGTTATNGRITHGSQGATVTLSGTNTISSTGSPGSVFAVQPTNVEGWWASQGIDSSLGRTGAIRRHQNFPDCNAWFKIQIRVTNLATAPASTTTLTIPYIVVSDYDEMVVDFAAAGNPSTGAGMPVFMSSPIGGTGSSATQIQGNVGHDGVVAGNPVRTGSVGRTSNFTAVASGDVTDNIATLVGVPIQRPFSIPELDFQVSPAAITTATTTVIQAAAGAGLKRYVTGLQFQNTSATATLVTIQRATTTIAQFNASASMAAPVTISFAGTPLQTGANEALNLVTSAAGSLLANVQGFTAP